jgi:hypothetical protein
VECSYLGISGPDRPRLLIMAGTPIHLDKLNFDYPGGENLQVDGKWVNITVKRHSRFSATATVTVEENETFTATESTWITALHNALGQTNLKYWIP